MDLDGNFNLSDIEFEEPTPNPFAGAGKASIDAIIANAIEDRIASKQFSKQLTFSKGRPGTQYRNALWYNRFESLREHPLRVSVAECPTGDQIERFITSIVGRVKPTSHTVPSFEWAKGGFRYLLLALVFHHKKFTLSRHESARISTTFQKLLDNGRLTRDPSRERNWVGVFLLRKIVTAVFHDALTRGTMNWDVTLSRITSIVLTAALSTRSGDIATDPTDNQPLPYLCYKDVTIKLVGGQDIEDLVAEVVVRNEKSKKDNPKRNRTVILHCLSEKSNNVLDPVKLILILALRSGNIGGANSIEDALCNLRVRKSRTIVWTRPERPVICSVVPRGSNWQPEKAAHRNQITKSIAEGGMTAGVIASLASHDIRFGAARDTANLSRKVKGVTTNAVAATLGHSKQALDKGITARYVGHISADTWTPRVEEEFEDPFGPQIEDVEPFAKRRRLSPAEVTALCKAKGLDPDDKKARAQAVYQDKQVKKKE